MKYLKASILFLLCSYVSLLQATPDFTANLQELNTRGYTVVPHVLSKAEQQQLLQAYQQAKNKALDIMAVQKPITRNFAENDTANQSVYWKDKPYLILQAGKGRYDLYKGFIQAQNPVLDQLMQQLMHGEFSSYSGIILSTPGSEDQYWHRDTNNLTNVGSDGSKLILMDDFYYTVLIPITVPFTKQNGTTEFMVGSHRLAAQDFTQCTNDQLEVPLGSALVFNGKINHRGKANLSNLDRPALYLVYHKRWYNDQYRTGVNED
jgi:ectoine hydroxylase-related dioxygenase (phytanoyl-CoA dioxygenase family)